MRERPSPRLIDWHVEFALRHRALIVVQDRDWESLSAEARERVRTLQREYVDLWAAQLCRRQPEVELEHARAMSHAAFGLINSSPHSGLLADSAMAELLTAMAMQALAVSPG